jgi:outer membrane autotransporter protein
LLRIGGLMGMTKQAWEGTMIEPFLIASLWGNFTDNNSVRLVSNGTTFSLNDVLDDVWGELSAGVNLFNFAQTPAVFAKVDYTFGEHVHGIRGKGGIRVAW